MRVKLAAVMAGAGDEWFEGTAGRTEEERAFFDALRVGAARSHWGIAPGHTASMSFLVPLYLTVDIPAMANFPGRRAARQLELTVWPWDSHEGLRLDGVWGNGHTPLDDVWVIEGGKLFVVGVEARPEELAEWAVRWIERQLARRLRFRTWKAGGAVATTEDTGEHVGLRASPWRRMGTPSSECVLPAREAHTFFTRE